MFLCPLDINECAIGSNICDSNANCINNAGSYNCSCRSGYTGNGKVCIGKESVGKGSREGGLFSDGGSILIICT